MSLEQAITDHAGALRELAAAIRSTISGAHDIGTATDKVIAEAKKTDAKPASSASGAKQETTDKKESAPGGDSKAQITAALAKAKAEQAAAQEAADAPTYDDVKTKVLALAQAKGRETLISLLQRHGVAKAPDLKEGQYARVIEDADAIMAGTYDPAAAEELA